MSRDITQYLGHVLGPDWLEIDDVNDVISKDSD